jgi:signal peptidase
MTKVFRALGSALLWLLAGLGLASALVWGATRLGAIQPLVVVSGSMEPQIMTGDLVVDRPVRTAQLVAGDVVSIRSAVTGAIVTHRVVGVEARPGGGWDVMLKGDANQAADGETYAVGDVVWRPVLRVPGAGAALVTLTRPAVAVPLGVALLALLGLSLLPAPDRRERAGVGAGGRHTAPSAGGRATPARALASR